MRSLTLLKEGSTPVLVVKTGIHEARFELKSFDMSANQLAALEEWFKTSTPEEIHPAAKAFQQIAKGPAGEGPVPTEASMMEERGKVYGDYTINMNAVGLCWQSILELHFQKPVDPIPGYVVCSMMAGFKVLRSVGPAFHEDNYIDGKTYLEMSRLVRKEVSK